MIRSCAALAAVLALACICLAGTAGAAQPAVTVPTPELETATVPVTQAAQPSLSVPTPPATTPSPAVAAPFTLALDRETAVWGDTVRCTGTGAGNSSVLVLVDGSEAGRVQPDAAGRYAFDYLVDRIPAGVHVVRAEAGPLRWAELVFEVKDLGTMILLDAVPSIWQNQSAVLCTGNVTANGKGVPNAPVHLVFDRYGWADAMTGPEGQFEVNAGVPAGKHEVVANVSFADGRPLGPAASGVVTAVVPGGPTLPPGLLPAAVLTVLILVAGGFLVVRRRRSQKGPEETLAGGGDLTPLFRPEAPAPMTAATVETAEVTPSAAAETPPSIEAGAPAVATATVAAVNGDGDLRAAAWALAGNGMRCGIGAVYGDLVAKLAAREPEAHLEGMTPRQLAAHFAGTPAETPIARITACYEAVTSTWRPPTPTDLEIMVEGYSVALAETADAGS